MKLVRRIWFRILISLLTGGMLAEIARIRFERISSDSSGTIVWICAIGMFGLLSLIVWIDKYRYYFISFKKKNDEDIIDDV
jgi:hypothetical protein